MPSLYYSVSLCLCGNVIIADSWETSNAQGFAAKGDLAKDQVSLLENVQLTLSLKFPEGYQPDLNAIKEHLLEHFGISEAPFALEAEQISSVENDGKDILNQTVVYHLSPHFAGTHELTFFDIPFETSNGKKVELISEIMSVKVRPPESVPEIYEPPLMTYSPALPVDTSSENQKYIVLDAQRAKAEASRNETIFNHKSIPWIGLAALTVGIIFLIVSIKSKARLPQKPKITVDPKKKAENDLRSLQANENVSSNEFYDQLTHILHEFLENYYNVKANTRTTEEFLHDMARHPLFNPEEQTFLQNFLIKADEVKFGHVPTSSKEYADILQHTRQFIVQKRYYS